MRHFPMSFVLIAFQFGLSNVQSPISIADRGKFNPYLCTIRCDSRIYQAFVLPHTACLEERESKCPG